MMRIVSRWRIVAAGLGTLAVATLVTAFFSPALPSIREDHKRSPCAAGSTEQFVDVQQQAPFAVYCPTYLPDGFRLERISFSRPKGGDHETGEMGASFVQPETGAHIGFDQGLLGNAMFPEWMQYGPPPKLGTIAYGEESRVTLYDERTISERGADGAIAWGEAMDGRQQLIFGTAGAVGPATLQMIAASMQRLGPFGVFTP